MREKEERQKEQRERGVRTNIKCPRSPRSWRNKPDNANCPAPSDFDYEGEGECGQMNFYKPSRFVRRWLLGYNLESSERFYVNVFNTLVFRDSPDT